MRLPSFLIKMKLLSLLLLPHVCTSSEHFLSFIGHSRSSAFSASERIFDRRAKVALGMVMKPSKQQPFSFSHLQSNLGESSASSRELPFTRRTSGDSNSISRRSFVLPSIFTIISSTCVSFSVSSAAHAAAGTIKKCTDIESCREIGERKVEADLKANPIVRLESNVGYRIVRPGVGDELVREGSTVDLAYSINKPGRYMYSQGFGLEKVNVDGVLQSDLGIDSLRVTVGSRDVPLGIEQAMIGMKRGERRRVELPASVGFETSNWNPAPQTTRGKIALDAYKRILEGGPNQPPFPAATIWEIEIQKIRKA